MILYTEQEVDAMLTRRCQCDLDFFTNIFKQREMDGSTSDLEFLRSGRYLGRLLRYVPSWYFIISREPSRDYETLIGEVERHLATRRTSRPLPCPFKIHDRFEEMVDPLVKARLQALEETRS